MVTWKDVVNVILCRQFYDAGYTMKEIAKTSGLSYYKVRKNIRDTARK